MVRLRSSTSGSVVPCGPKNCSRILLSSPITCQPSDARSRTHSEPIKPPDPVMIAFFDTLMSPFAVYHCGVALWSASRFLTPAVLQVFRNHDMREWQLRNSVGGSVMKTSKFVFLGGGMVAGYAAKEFVARGGR